MLKYVSTIIRHSKSYLLMALIFSLIYAVYFAFASPQHEFPLNDDWGYAQSVRHLMETGELHVSDWASATTIFQTYWAAVFASLLGGFSFTALRISTLAFSFISCLALYDLLRQLDLSAHIALLGGLVLIVSPMFIYLSYTFMSDIFYFGLMLLSLSFYIRGIKRDAPWALLMGSVFAAGAILSRQLGIVLPLAATAALIFKDRRLRWTSLLLIGALPGAVAIGYYLWLRFINGVPWALEFFSLQGTTDLLAKPLDYIPRVIWRILLTALYIGLLTLPVFLAQITSSIVDRRRLKRLSRIYLVWFALLVALAFIYHRSMPYLGNAINDIGIGTVDLAGDKTLVTPSWVFWLVTVIGPFAGAAQATLWTEVVLNARRESRQAASVLLIASVGMAMLTLIAFVYFWDEYLIVFVPVGLYLGLHFGTIGRRGWIVALAACAAIGTYTLIEMSDHMNWNEARWQAGSGLVAQGVSPGDIDGGLEWVGWYKFETALPQAIADGKKQELWAWYYLTPFSYRLAFSPQLGYTIVDRVSYPTAVVGRTGQIYILKRETP